MDSAFDNETLENSVLTVLIGFFCPRTRTPQTEARDPPPSLSLNTVVRERSRRDKFTSILLWDMRDGSLGVFWFRKEG